MRGAKVSVLQVSLGSFEASTRKPNAVKPADARGCTRRTSFAPINPARLAMLRNELLKVADDCRSAAKAIEAQ